MDRLTVSILLSTIALCAGALVKTSEQGHFELLILHNNDMHARFEQTSRLSGICTLADREAGLCYGGFPRVAHVVKEARHAAQTRQGPPVLYLNAGDTYTGTPWFTIYKWKIAAEFLNALQPDAVSLGNHEFDNQVQGLIPFIRNISTPVLAANLILDKVPELNQETNLRKSIILERDGVKIGIIGYLTAETKFLAPKNDVEYEDEVIAIRREVHKLKMQHVNILIALGHSGFTKDLEIARDVEDIDLVIGGHSNTFLWNSPSTNEKPERVEGPYPVEVKQPSGRIVRVVQAYAYTKYLGSLNIIFDRYGEIVHCEGDPILLDQKIPGDPELLKVVEKYSTEIERINNVAVGNSSVVLHGEYCRLRECNIGVVIADSIVNYTKEHLDRYRDVNIAIVQGGRIRTSIDRPQKPYEMTRGDWVTVLPFTDTLTVVTMNGSILLESLEHSVQDWRVIDASGQFLQFAGMRVVYDLAKPPGSRVVSAKALNSNRGELIDIVEGNEYRVIMCLFLAEGGDGYTNFEKLPKDILSYNEVDAVIYYLSRIGLLTQRDTGRLTVLNTDKVKELQVQYHTNTINSSMQILSSKNLGMFCILCVLSYFISDIYF